MMNALRIGDIQVDVPIIQGGMGVAISLAGLASAVANQGGIGMISAAGVGMREPNYAKNFKEANRKALQFEIRKAKSLTKGIVGVNIMMALSDHEDLVITSIQENIDLIVLGAGLPLKIPAVIEQAGLAGHHTKLVVKVSSAKAAKLIFQYWASKYNFIPDAVVVEGPLAGGHLGFKKTELIDESISLKTLIQETVKEVKVFENKYDREIPVIAAGGIYTGKDIYEIMQAGAKGVKMGTRFVTTYECDASPVFKESYLTCKKEDIAFIDSPVGLPGRVIKNEYVKQMQEGNTKPFKCVWHCLSSCNYKEAPYCISKALANAADGHMEEGFAFAGAKAYLATKIQHVSEIFQELQADYNLQEMAGKAIQTVGFMPLKAAVAVGQ